MEFNKRKQKGEVEGIVKEIISTVLVQWDFGESDPCIER